MMTNVCVIIYSFSFFFSLSLQQVSLYSCKRKTQRWPLCLFYNLLDISCYNAFVLRSHIDSDWKWGCLYRRRLFIKELGKALVTPLIQSSSLRQGLCGGCQGAGSSYSSSGVICGARRGGEREGQPHAVQLVSPLSDHWQKAETGDNQMLQLW